MDMLKRLEDESIYILREAYHAFERLAILWSLGKDSNVMIWLAKKAFFGRVPFPAVHVDTGKKFKEMYAFRDTYAKTWKLDLVRGLCPDLGTIDDTLTPAARSAARKTEGLKNIVREKGYQGLILGIRRDEQATRAKERFFSPRGESGAWDIRDQPPEFWGQYNTSFSPNTHVRVHPLLSWSEVDIWRYIERESIPVVDLYFSKKGKRYRSLGDKDITHPIDSDAKTVKEIIAELETTKVSERAGRAMDHEREDAFERLRADGYM
ncbi:MAG: sulfate adenylyltransferase subunit 2 [Alphaproteobacteria bacterium GM7ARS4]|nr:sulfate adenylyltransferase subunit 2 [Alphaproteobacteria bacterium GM7ARS4]